VSRGTPLLHIDERPLRADVAARDAMLASTKVRWEPLEQRPRPNTRPFEISGISKKRKK